jgi:hypothetical protein
MYPLTTNNSVAIAVGDPVALVGGSIVPLTANPVSGTLSANTPIGVFMGVDYVDLNGKRPFVEAQYLPANAVSSLGYTNIMVHVHDDHGARYELQANGTVAATYLGANVNMGQFNSADAVNGTSRVYADSTTLDQSSGSTKALRIVGFGKTQDNAAGDTYTKLIVKWNAGVHAFTFAGAH